MDYLVVRDGQLVRARGAERDAEIERVSAALARSDGEIERMAEEWERSGGPCCPGCMFGARYSAACAKSERISAWLVVLLWRRDGRGDRERIVRLGFDSIEATRMRSHLVAREARRVRARS